MRERWACILCRQRRSFDREIGTRFKWGTAPIPLVSGGGVVSGGMVAVILTKDEAKRKAAFDYIRFGTSADSQAYVVQNTGYMPVNIKAVPTLETFYADKPAWKTSVLQLPTSRPLIAWPGENGVRISQRFVDGMTALANGQTDAAQTLAAIAADVKALLPK
jgi:multiple sugar transport system substrate-binding protein